jgi:hypothetical protein
LTAISPIPPFIFADAVRAFWDTRLRQQEAQQLRGAIDQGLRSSVTGGKQMDGFARIIVELMLRAGVDRSAITLSRGAVLPGYFRSTKQWDVLVVSDGQLRAALELKSMSSSFGNNWNNRVEEALGNAVDLWTAYREGAISAMAPPWLGYLFVLADVEASRMPVSMVSPHFPPMSEFHQASYARRAELLCRRLVLERYYTSACLILTDPDRSIDQENYAESANDLAATPFLESLLRHVAPM